ncbi:uncharacterized protein LOC110404880 [Numida meleagris]|uniref:uncharacterized protein LOC110404880 n=1 Tax=Numida meleagris TaxID=8996 RepID=UPI000B3DBF62|nr:uncharacterized protein LOC110404880 [Numida meleagris]
MSPVPRAPFPACHTTCVSLTGAVSRGRVLLPSAFGVRPGLRVFWRTAGARGEPQPRRGGSAPLRRGRQLGREGRGAARPPGASPRAAAPLSLTERRSAAARRRREAPRGPAPRVPPLRGQRPPPRSRLLRSAPLGSSGRLSHVENWKKFSVWEARVGLSAGADGSVTKGNWARARRGNSLTTRLAQCEKTEQKRKLMRQSLMVPKAPEKTPQKQRRVVMIYLQLCCLFLWNEDDTPCKSPLWGKWQRELNPCVVLAVLHVSSFTSVMVFHCCQVRAVGCRQTCSCV